MDGDSLRNSSGAINPAGKRPRNYYPESPVSEEEEDSSGREKLVDVHAYLDRHAVSIADRISLLRGLANYYTSVQRAMKKESGDQ